MSLNYEMNHDLLFRNNLTVIESILLRGEGGIGSLQVGHREASSPITPIDITIDEKQHTLCSSKSTLSQDFLFRRHFLRFSKKYLISKNDYIV